MSLVDYSIHYGKWAATDDRIAAWNARRYVRQLERWLPADKSARILEIGPGNGLALSELAAAGYGPEGIEADKELAILLMDKGLNVKWIKAEDTICHLEAHRDSYGLVYAKNVMEHVPVDSQIDLVRAVAGSLQLGGHFVCETPNALAPLANWHRYMDWTHTCLFTTFSLEFILANAGLEPVYVGAALDESMPPKGGAVTAPTKRAIVSVLRFLSRSIHRLHIAAELGQAGLSMPVTPALLAAGRKP
jgi:SAM-dependent methyltransferase